MAVVRAVSTAEGRDPRSLPPLTTVVDPDALDSLFASQFGGELRQGGRVSFVYSDYRVTIDTGDCLVLQSLEDRDTVQ